MNAAAVRHLKRADPVMARVIAKVGPCRFATRPGGSHFAFIVRAIVFQQLSTKAATTIHGRVLDLFGGALDPAAVARAADADLRAAGLSRQKASYVKDLGAKVADGTVGLDHLADLDDAAIIDELTRVKGIGVWSAQMFLIFRLGRPDVLPVLDLGIRKGAQRAYGLRTVPSTKRLEKLARPWSPYATIACWYLWRLLDGPAAG